MGAVTRKTANLQLPRYRTGVFFNLFHRVKVQLHAHERLKVSHLSTPSDLSTKFGEDFDHDSRKKSWIGQIS